MPDHYDTEKWKDYSTKNLFIWRYFMSGNELSGWRLKETRPWEDIKTETVCQYYWENPADKAEEVKIDIIECHSSLHAQQQLLVLLKRHMHIQIPEGREKGIKLGDVVYTGTGKEPQHLMFLRANLVTILNSIGKKTVSVAKMALQLDNLFNNKPRTTGSGVTPVIRSFSIGSKGRKINEQKEVQVKIEASDPLQRPLWYKLTAKRGELLAKNGDLRLLFTPGVPNQLTGYAINKDGNTAEKTLDF